MGARCTLRAAIQQANATLLPVRITFAAGVTLIAPGAALPTITHTVTISACVSGVPTVQLVGSSAGPNVSGLTLGTGSSGSLIEGLVIRNYWTDGSLSAGIRILSTSTNNNVRCNRIGTNLAGTAASANNAGMVIDSSGNTIGGVATGDRNVISGNTYYGLFINGSGNIVQGNYIGTSPNGSAAVGNGTGMDIRGSSNLIGGTSQGEGNVISGNGDAVHGGAGIAIVLASSNSVQGNYIGTNAAGSAALPNYHGVILQFGATNNTIGGTTAGAGNLISGNSFFGVLIDGELVSSDDNIIQGNRIGTNAAGTSALPNRTGVEIYGSGSTRIGGSATGAGNLISGNTDFGVYVVFTVGTVVQGNSIGTNVSGTGFVPNGAGVLVLLGSSTTIGGTVPGAGNLISGNTTEGVRLAPGNPSTGTRINGNSIAANGALGIDLGGDGVTANDSGDADLGVNNQQNFPVLTSANNTSIGGTLSSVASKTYRVEFFTNEMCDGNGFGEGKTFLGFVNVTTDGAGNGAFSFAPSTPLTDADFITATATDRDGNTSEFSQCKTLAPTGESVSQAASAGGTVTTDAEGDGATPGDPLETWVTTPNAGTLTLTEGPTSTSTTGYSFLGQQVQITAPAGTATSPLVLRFHIDASQFQPGQTPANLVILRNGAPVQACTGPVGQAVPDPCVSSRVTLGDGDGQITVLTSVASLWNFAVPASFAARAKIAALEGAVSTLPSLSGQKEGSLRKDLLRILDNADSSIAQAQKSLGAGKVKEAFDWYTDANEKLGEFVHEVSENTTRSGHIDRPISSADAAILINAGSRSRR